MKNIKTAIIPVAGLGTIMLPATKAIPKKDIAMSKYIKEIITK